MQRAAARAYAACWARVFAVVEIVIERYSLLV
jgi:hypothetical protein